MDDFELIKLKTADQLLVVMRTCESPFDYMHEICTRLNDIKFEGFVIVDELLHSGNTDERFLKFEFRNNAVVEKSFSFISIPKQNDLRKHLCQYLKTEPDFLHSSGLTTVQIKLIEHNCVI